MNKKIMMLIMIIAIAGLAFSASNPVRSETPKFAWKIYRANVATADSALAATTKTWALRPTTKLYAIPEEYNNLEIRFRGVATTTGVYTIYLYGQDDDAVKVCTGNLTIGAQTASLGTSNLYMGTITSTSSWSTSVVLADAAGADGMARILFDAAGYSFMYIELSTISADDSISIDIRGF